MSIKFDPAFLRRSRATMISIRMLDAIQDEPLDYMAASIGLVLETLCEEKGLQPSDVMTAVHNMLRTTGLEDDNYVTGLRQYIQDEIPD